MVSVFALTFLSEIFPLLPMSMFSVRFRLFVVRNIHPFVFPQFLFPGYFILLIIVVCVVSSHVIIICMLFLSRLRVIVSIYWRYLHCWRVLFLLHFLKHTSKFQVFAYPFYFITKKRQNLHDNKLFFSFKVGILSWIWWSVSIAKSQRIFYV